jgi:hypothetical protein
VLPFVPPTGSGAGVRRLSPPATRPLLERLTNDWATAASILPRKVGDVVHVRISGAGTANWSTPIRVEENVWKANYETFFVHRYAFDDGRQIHVRTRYAGVDDISADGTVFAGIGSFEGMDDDGDWHHGRIDWIIRGDYQAGVYNFLFGTGKWQGVEGALEAPVWAEPEKVDQVMPPTGPIRFWGYIEGEGDLTLPNFGS